MNNESSAPTAADIIAKDEDLQFSSIAANSM